VKEAADAAMKAAAEVTKRDMAEALARTAEQVAKNTAKTGMFKWATACLGTAVAALAIVGLLAYRQGAGAGYARGWGDAYARAADEKAAASWANTPEGELAYGLAQEGSVRALATCDGQGWIRKKGVCLPMPERGTVHGWRVPIETPARKSR
jgi:hypothetical protein